MGLTLKGAVEKSIEAWEELAERGCRKHDIGMLSGYDLLCPLCHYNQEQTGGRLQGCSYCPLPGEGRCRCEIDGTYFSSWCDAGTEPERKHYAHLFLEQLRQIKLPEEKEEWEDVTSKCTVVFEHDLGKTGGSCIEVLHNDGWIMELGVGAGEHRISGLVKGGKYEIEDCGTVYNDPQHLFKVWKKL